MHDENAQWQPGREMTPVRTSPARSLIDRIPAWGWYLFWFGAVLAIYWPGVVILPKRDQAVFMMGRHLAETDLDWFLGILSYNRTRVVQQGDYFAFRPV